MWLDCCEFSVIEYNILQPACDGIKTVIKFNQILFLYDKIQNLVDPVL